MPSNSIKEFWELQDLITDISDFNGSEPTKEDWEKILSIASEVLKPMGKYRSEYAHQLTEMFKNGEDVAEVANKLGISKSTFHNWVIDHPEFKKAYEFGKTASEAWWTRLGRAGAAGKVTIQPASWIFNMRNKFQWTDKHVHDVVFKEVVLVPPAKPVKPTANES